MINIHGDWMKQQENKKSPSDQSDIITIYTVKDDLRCNTVVESLKRLGIKFHVKDIAFVNKDMAEKEKISESNLNISLFSRRVPIVYARGNWYEPNDLFLSNLDLDKRLTSIATGKSSVKISAVSEI